MVIWRIIFFVIRLALVLCLPFIVLIRGAIYVHTEFATFPWISILFGTIIMTGVLLLYFNIFYGRLTGLRGKPGWLKRRSKFALLVASLYVLQSVFFISTKNTKGSEVHREYRNLHPILRMSVSTFMLVDKSLLITDGNRNPEDYRKMGLPTKSHSLHYPQSTGYAHAVDIRTSGKAEWKNQLMKTYFKWMGFKTLRHGGTGDHLHISLFSHDTPHAI